jgi:superfamily II DNA/RNA helicase
LTSFSDLGVPARLVDVLATLDIHTPTPIQHATLPDALAGRDVLGRGRTGSGKTLAFLLPVVARLEGGEKPRAGAPRALILAPTRELAAQIDTALRPLAAAARLSSRTVFGGVPQNPQIAALRRGIDIVIACPGRLEDLIAQGHCSLARAQITVLDEADHMADLGFLPAVRRLLDRTPAHGQRMLFSATLDRAVDTLVRRYLSDPAVHEADSAQSPVGTMTHHVLQVERDQRLSVLVELTSTPGRTVVFTRTKRSATTLARQLARLGVAAVELHGNLSQNARTRNLEQFHAGQASTLVATDIAARGIHVDDVTLVIHADPPADHKAYLHRSGRTARAGNAGTVITLASAAQQRDVAQLAAAAGITATTRLTSSHRPLVAISVPGARLLPPPASGSGDAAEAPVTISRPAGRSRSGRRSAGRSPDASRPRPNATRAHDSHAKVAARGSTAGRASSPDQQANPSPSSHTPQPTHSAAAFSARRR